MTTQEMKLKLIESLFDNHYNDCICRVCTHIRKRLTNEIKRRESKSK